MTTDYRNDIPLSLAISAHNGTSFSPDKRGQQELDGYQQTLESDFASLSKIADTDEKRELLESEFSRYREGYRNRTLLHLSAKGRCMSTMITGGSNYPVRQQEKRHESERNRCTELIEFRERALKAIRRKLCPEDGPIMSGDSDGVARLTAEIDKAERLQKQMKDINAAHKKYTKKPELLETFPEAWRSVIRDYVPAYSWEPHPFAPYQLTNNGANIRRMKQRLAVISRNQEKPDSVIESGEIRIKDSPADNRIRLFFPGKPDADVRGRLKSNGYRWTPSLGCWQAYRNDRAMNVAREFIQQAKQQEQPAESRESVTA